MQTVTGIPTDTDNDNGAPSWPAPLPAIEEGVSTADAFPGWAPLPVDPGEWGRPPARADGEPPLGSRVDASAVSAAPPLLLVPPRPPAPAPALPTAPAREEPQRRGLRWLRRGVVLETAVAVAILLVLALSDSTGGASPSLAWKQAARPVITRLLGDIANLERDSAPATPAPPARRSLDAIVFDRDLAAAKGLPAPPNSALAAAWAGSLGSLTSAEPAVESPSPGHAAADARGRLQFLAAAAELVDVARRS